MIVFGSNWLFNTEHPMFFSQKQIQKVGVWKTKIFFFFRGGPAGAEGQAPRSVPTGPLRKKKHIRCSLFKQSSLVTRQNEWFDGVVNFRQTLPEVLVQIKKVSSLKILV